MQHHRLGLHRRSAPVKARYPTRPLRRLSPPSSGGGGPSGRKAAMTTAAGMTQAPGTIGPVTASREGAASAKTTAE
jgi:hypothetical protein